jgi:hypothetical protein
MECNKDVCMWENISNYVAQREASCNVSGPQSSAKDASDIAECYE